MKVSVTQAEWLLNNANAINWYYETYPFLKKFDLPVATTTLRNFYISDSKKRNITPNEQYLSTYDFLFSYFLENYPKQNDNTRFTAQSNWELLGTGLTEGFKKTFQTDLPNIFGSVSNTVIIVLVLILLIILFKR